MNAYPAEVTTSKGITAKVIRTDRRKTAQVRVVEGKVSILVPHNLSASRIDEILTRKTRWIRGKMYQQGLAVPVQPKEYISGESFTYLGRKYRLKLQKASKTSVKLLNGRWYHADKCPLSGYGLDRGPPPESCAGRAHRRCRQWHFHGSGRPAPRIHRSAPRPGS